MYAQNVLQDVAGMKKAEAITLVNSQKGDFSLDRQLTPKEFTHAEAMKGGSYFDFEEITPESGREEIDEKEKAFQDKCVEYLEEHSRDGVVLTQIISGLAGIDSERAWKIREKFIEIYHESKHTNILQGLAGVDSERAWELRDKLLLEIGLKLGVKAKFQQEDICKSLVGLDSERAYGMREKIIKDGELVISYAGIDSEKAWKLRDKLIADGDDYEIKRTISSLVGIDSDRAWKMRENFKMLGDREDVTMVLVESLAGLDSEKAWEIRQEYLDKGIAEPMNAIKSSLAKSLIGVDSPRAWEMRQKLLEQGVNNAHIAYSLGGLDSPKAWEERERLIREVASGNKEISEGLYGGWKMVAIRKARKDALEKESAGP